MPHTLGTLTEDLPANSLPALSLCVLGSRREGPLGEARFYGTPAEAVQCLGGTTVARLGSSPVFPLTLPTSFSPDDETLRLNLPSVYHCPPDQSYSVRYPYLTSISASGSPVVLTADTLGPSIGTFPALGGLFLEAPGILTPLEKTYVQSGCGRGDLLLPLLSALGESAPVAGLRVGTSWLPYGPASLTLPCGVILTLSGQGGNDKEDAYLSAYARITPTSLILDPGLLGLPYIRRTYLFSRYPTWRLLISALREEGRRGFHPFIPDGDGPDSVPALQDTIFHVAYGDGGIIPPDLTTALGWQKVLTSESLDLSAFDLLCLSGLSGDALAQDTQSALQILASIGDSVLVLPWSLDTPCPGDPLQPVINEAAILRAVLGAYGSRLLLVWGWGYPEGLPTYRSHDVLMPSAYTVAAAISEGTRGSSGNPLRPRLSSLSSRPGPFFAPGSVQSPDLPTLEAMRAVGLAVLTKSTFGWTVHGPLACADGTPLSRSLCLLSLRRTVEDALDPYLGKPDSPGVRTQISAVLDGISATFPATRLGLFLGDLTLALQPQQNPGMVEVRGSANLYGEVRTIELLLSFTRRA